MYYVCVGIYVCIHIGMHVCMRLGMNLAIQIYTLIRLLTFFFPSPGTRQRNVVPLEIFIEGSNRSYQRQ